ncbi:hypothetical protein ACJ6WF_43580 [Streptomyces sp. MMS24-I2-30]|uniref:hypothetical protein n=1 Tax=Streptomyces sp. MMS24-I2-30 TaxID=3351564 RepID=UPI003896DEC5
MAVDVLAGEGDEEAARLGLPAVEYGRRGHCHGGVALDRGDLPEAERDHAVSLWVMPPVKAPRCIAGVSKTAYVPATPRCLDWRA